MIIVSAYALTLRVDVVDPDRFFLRAALRSTGWNQLPHWAQAETENEGEEAIEELPLNS